MNSKLLVSFGCLALAGHVVTANAQILYQDDFNTGTDANWTRWAGDNNAAPPASFSFPVISAGNLGYQMQDSPGTSSYFTTARVGSYVTGLSMTDGTVYGDLVNYNNSAGYNNIMGVMARVQNPVSAGASIPSGYILAFVDRAQSGGGGTDQLRIFKTAVTANGLVFLNDGLGNQGQFGVVAGGSAAPHPGGDYRLEFTLTGSTFIGRIFDVSANAYMTFNDGNGGLTDFIHASDPGTTAIPGTYASGSAGFINVPNSVVPGVDATFDNFMVVVPEPGSLTLLALGMGALYCCCGRKHR